MRGDRVDSTKNNIREHYRPTIPQSHQHQEYVTGLCMAGVLALLAARLLVFVGASPSSNAFPYGRNGPFLTKQFLTQNDTISCSSDNYEPFPGKQQIPKCDFFFLFFFILSPISTVFVLRVFAYPELQSSFLLRQFCNLSKRVSCPSRNCKAFRERLTLLPFSHLQTMDTRLSHICHLQTLNSPVICPSISCKSRTP